MLLVETKTREARDMPYPDSFKDRFNEDDEKGKSVVYLDNATIINACTLLANPERFDVYKLLDLESFCEAFLLFDCVRTLVGNSFACAISSCYQFPEGTDWQNPSAFKDAVWVYPKNREEARSSARIYDPGTSKLYGDLIDRSLLRPVALDAGTVHYGIENIHVLDAVARTIDVGQTVKIMGDIFGEDIPWDYGPSGADNAESRRRKAWYNLVIGEMTGSSDSYPVYHFPTPEQKERGPGDDDFGWELRHNRLTGRVETFVSQTFFYVTEASLHRKPYICSSMRVPIVRDMLSQLNRQFVSVVHGSLGSVSQKIREKVEAAIRFLGSGAIDFLYLPALFAVLRQSSSRAEVIPALLAMRDREDVRAYRVWCTSVQEAWQDQDLIRVSRSIEELRQVSANLGRALAGQSIRGVLNHVANVGLLARGQGAELSRSDLLDYTFNPSLSFVKDVGNYLELIRENREIVESVLEHKLTNRDVATLEQLRARRDQLYSPGGIEEGRAEVTIGSMEVTMGDTFKDITNAIIATRGSIARGIISLREEGDERIAEAVATLDRLINEASKDVLDENRKVESSDLLNGIVEEARKPNPNKNILRSLGESLLGILTTVKPLAEAGKEAIGVLKALWL
jgi:hypothetical protein